MLRKCKFQVILVCTHRQHMCQGQETVGPALSPFPFCWQEGSVQAVQIYCSAPVRLLCLRVGPTSGYQDSKTGDSTEICCQVGHQPLVIGLSGPNPTHELAPSCYTSKKRKKLLLCRCILLGGSVIPPSVFTPHPHPSPRLHHCMALHCPNTRTSAHLHSFLPSTVKLWNELSSELISLCTQAVA